MSGRNCITVMDFDVKVSSKRMCGGGTANNHGQSDRVESVPYLVLVQIDHRAGNGQATAPKTSPKTTPIGAILAKNGRKNGFVLALFGFVLGSF